MAERQGQIFTKITHRHVGRWVPANRKEGFGDLDVRELNKYGTDTVGAILDSIAAHTTLVDFLSAMRGDK